MDESSRDRLHHLQALTTRSGADAARPASGRATRVHPWWTLLMAALGGLLLGALGMNWLARPIGALEPLPPARASAPATAATPNDASIARAGALVAAGHVVARRQTTVGAELTGRIDAVLVAEGQMVKAGEPLARLDSALVELDLAAARSRVDSSQASIGVIDSELRDARESLRRTEDLVRTGFVSVAELTRAELRVQGLQSQLARVQAEHRSAAVQLERTSQVVRMHTIRAPFGGVVVDVTAQAGEVISPTSAGGAFTRTGIATIVDLRSLEVEVEIMESQLSRVRPGQSAVARMDSSPELAVRVHGVLPRANRERGTMRVRLNFVEAPPAGVLPDMAVQVSFAAS